MSDRAPALAEIANDVYAWLAPSPGSGCANAGVVVDDDGITVIDTLMVRSQWEPFAAAVSELGAPVRRIVLTSARIDSVGGTKAFPHASIYGSPQASVVLDEPMPIDAYRAFMPQFAAELLELGEVGTRPTTHLIDDPASLTARVEVVPVIGHTEGDVLVIVEDADVMFAGGICSFGVTPLGFQGDFDVWLGVLDMLPDLADTIVPGHGRIGGADEVARLHAYLRACVAADGDVTKLADGPWRDWTDRDLDAVNVERAAMMARGEDAIPPTMRRMIGIN